MTTISGNNVTITPIDFMSNKDKVLVRDSITTESIDLTPTVTDLTNLISGPPYTIEYTFKIHNSSDHKIELACNTGFTMIPGPTDTIMPKVTKNYEVRILSQTTGVIYNLDHNGQQIIAEKVITNVIERDTTIIQPVQIFNNTTEITIGQGPILDVNDNGDVNIYGNIFSYTSVAYLNANTNLTYTAGQVLGGFIKRDSTSDRTDTLPTASDLISTIKNPKVGTSFVCHVQQASSANKNLTIQDNTGITISGTDVSIKRYYTIILLFVITNPNQGNEAITCYVMGTLRDANKGNVPNITNVTTNSYTITDLDDTINVDTDDIKGLCTLTLPEISIIGQNRYHITDSTGDAGKYNIKIVPSGSDTIERTDFFTINSGYSSISMYNDEVGNWVLY